MNQIILWYHSKQTGAILRTHWSWEALIGNAHGEAASLIMLPLRFMPCMRPLVLRPSVRSLGHCKGTIQITRSNSTTSPSKFTSKKPCKSNPGPFPWFSVTDNRFTVFPERLLIYHAGTGRSVFLGCLRVTTIFVFAFFSLVVAPTHFYSETEPLWVAGAGKFEIS